MPRSAPRESCNIEVVSIGRNTLATAKSAKVTAKTSSKSSTKTSKPVVTKTAKTPVAEKAPVAKAPKANSTPEPKHDTKHENKHDAKHDLRAAALAGLPAPSKIAKDGLLSEADIIKQAKTNYMSQDQLDFFKHRLRELGAQLRENAGATTEHLRELAVAPDPADRATLEEEHALELRARDRERKLLKKVEGALVRIESGEYGYCEETGEPIGIQRLLARPTATLTIEAQERRELKQKMYGE
jgi:DnaK suppressor protein